MEKFKNFYNSDDLIGTQYLFFGILRNFKVGEVKIFSENRKYGNSKYYSRIFNYLKILKLIFIVKKSNIIEMSKIVIGTANFGSNYGYKKNKVKKVKLKKS